MIQDFRFALRLILKEPLFSAAVTVVLALGIGVNAIGFTIVNAAFLRGLPYESADRLHVLAWQTRVGFPMYISPADLAEWRADRQSFEALGAYRANTFNLSDERSLPEPLRGAWVTANAFRMLHQAPLIGRDFTDDDERPGAQPTVIIGSSIWRSRYGGDPDIIGRTLRLNGQEATIIGVMPPSMKFPQNTDIWSLFVPNDVVARDSRSLTAFGLRRDGATLGAARAEMNAMAGRLAAAHPDTNAELVGVRVATFADVYIGGRAAEVFRIIMVGVCFVLLIACANVANLLLSRSARRAREIGVRTALGATRSRIVRQLLLESLVLSAFGGAMGFALAYAAARVIDASIQDPGRPFWIVFSADGVVFGYVAAVCVVTAIVFGLAPALHVSKTNLNDVMKDGGRGSTGTGSVRSLTGVLVVGELALTVVLLVGAGLMLRSILNADTLDIGIRTDHLSAMRMELMDAKYATPAARLALYDRLEPRLASIPGVEAIAITSAVPPFSSGDRTMEVEGRPSGQPPTNVTTITISPRFFDTAGAPIRRGRAFRDTDGNPGTETVIVNERLVGMFFKGEDPIGQRLRFVPRQPPPGAAPSRPAEPAPPPPVWRTIVGVSRTIRHGGIENSEANPVVYVPHRQEPPGGGWLVVRSALPPGSVMDAVRRAVQSVDPDQPVYSIQTLDQMLSQNYGPLKVFGSLFVVLGVVALVLAATGLYGVMAYSVSQRTQEIGVRMALGAGAPQVSWMVLRRGLVQLAIGLSLGLAGAFALSRVLRSVLVRITPSDPVTFVTITVLLALVAIAACLVPARRATRVDPLVALRAE